MNKPRGTSHLPGIGALLVVVMGSVTGCGSNEVADKLEQQTEALSPNPWTQFSAPFPNGNPGTLALLPDGRVLAAKEAASPTDIPSTAWFALSPDAHGLYTSGTWAAVGMSTLGRFASPSFVLIDGRFLVCGGEGVTDNFESALHTPNTDRARCEIFDPATNTWSQVADMPETIGDTPAAELDDGEVLVLSAESTNSYLFQYLNGTPGWTRTNAFSRSAINEEASSVLLRDGSVLVGNTEFQRYVKGTGWLNTASTPVNVDNEFSQFPEIGPFVLLQQGTVLVLGGNSHNGIFTPPTTLMGPGSWALVDDAPSPFNHGDTPATVEKDGKVLTAVSTSTSGDGQATGSIYEFDPTAPTGMTPSQQWTSVPSPTPQMGLANRMRMLNLPNGQILFSGTNDGTLWAYNPAGAPQSGWRPTITSITGPSAGEFTLNGTQLNGLTDGGDFGDDAKTNTNFPVISLVDSAGNLFFARSYNFQHMTPGQSTSCKFVLPPAIQNATYNVFVSANGVSSSSSKTLTVTGNHVMALTQVSTPGNAGQTSLWQVSISNVAPSGGLNISLSTSNASVVTVPSTVTITQGQRTGSFSVTTRGLGTATLTAQQPSAANNQFKPVTALFGWQVRILSGPPIYSSELTSTWNLGISQPAPSNGVTVNLANGNAAVATVPATVFFPSGATDVVFTVGKGASTNGVAKITASLIGTSRSFTVGTDPIADNIGNNDPPSQGRMGFMKCANEGQTCVVGSPGYYVAFGSGGQFVYKSTNGSTIGCDSTSFGADPGGSAPRACWFAPYSFIATENGPPVVLSAPTEIAYGANGSFRYAQLSGQFTCNTATFGGIDPAQNVVKACLVGVSAQTQVALEGQPIQSAVLPVAYGASGRFFFKLAGNGVLCANGTFTGTVPDALRSFDPNPGIPKACYTLQSTVVGDEGQALNLGGRFVYYGSGLNGNFLGKLITTGTCDNATFGGDPDFGHTKHCWDLPL